MEVLKQIGRAFMKMMRSEKGQLISNINNLIIAIVMLVAVATPITIQTVSAANVTGITATIFGFLPTFLGLGALRLVSSISG